MQFLIGSLFGTKCDLLDTLLGKGKVMVHLDARRDGVEVPTQFQGDHHLRLKLSLWFGIDDFVYDDAGVRASLSFGGKRFYCVLPWHAIFAMTSHVEPIGYLWPDDLPKELAAQLTPAEAGAHAASPPTREARPAASAFRVVEGGRADDGLAGADRGEETEESPSDDAPVEVDEVSGQEGDETPGRRYGHLRVVK